MINTRFLYALLLLGISAGSSLQASVAKLRYGNNQQIVHVGTTHSINPRDAQYATLQKAWNSFIQETGGQYCCVIIEKPTTHNLPTFTSFEDAITKCGDYGAAVYLAQQHHIPVIAGDPLVRQAFKKIIDTKEFNADHVRYAYFAQLLTQYNYMYAQKITGDTSSMEFVEPYFTALFPNISMDYMIALHEKLTGRVFNPLDSNFYTYITWCPAPTSLQGALFYQFDALKELRKIMKLYHIKRDIATIALIKNEISVGRNVFIVYGNHHQEFHLKGLTKIIDNLTQESASQDNVL